MHILGIDLGTSGLKAVVCSAKGDILVDSSIEYNFFTRKDNFIEQNPNLWLTGLSLCLDDIVRKLEKLNDSSKNIGAIGVTSTSGTIVFIDEQGNPLHSAIMYHDRRCKLDSEKWRAATESLFESTGYRIKYTFALPKLIWVKEHLPDVYEKAYKVVSEGDFVIGKLIGNYSTSDFTNLLKLGYDVKLKEWNIGMIESLGIRADMLPKAVPPGNFAGYITPEIAKRFGFSPDTKVYRGLIDNNAAYLSSGARLFGDCYTNIGSVLSIKVLQKDLIRDSEGRLYNYPYPTEGYLFGGSSSAGVGSIQEHIGNFNRDVIIKALSTSKPNDNILYPLRNAGEVLPFVDPDFRGFEKGKFIHSADRFVAGVEGLSFIERWVYEISEALGANMGDTVYSTGGGTMCNEWSQIRADILGKNVVVPAYTGAALGVAILVASKIYYSNLRDAQENMVNIGAKFKPNSSTSQYFNEKYEKFKQETLRRINF